MIETSTVAQALQTGDIGGSSGVASLKWFLRVESWYNGVLLHDDIPVSDAAESSDRTASVPERLSLSVPLEVDGYLWSPEDDDLHPLAANGQRLKVMIGLEIGRDSIEWVQRGEYLITRTTPDADSVQVEALGLLALIEEARLVNPYQPTGTIKSAIRGLVEPALTVVFSDALTDRAVPSGINYDEDRLGALNELLDAWPAEMRMNGQGYLEVFLPVEPTMNNAIAVFNNYYIDLSGEVMREGAVNCVVARGTAADGGQVQGVAYDYSTGPHRFGGPFNPLPVPEFFASPLLTTVTQCRSAAQTRLNRRRRQLRRPLRVTVPPMTFLQFADVVRAGRIGSAITDVIPCTIEAMTLPLVPGSDVPMTLTLAGDPDAT